ncbi:MAG: hypothetical protein OQK79_05495 [Rhodanobacter sp.]|jgi:hypothetical protein|nr:hypothetical protein [Rhodanobacter sp.]
MIVYTVKQTDHANWVVRRMGATLCGDMERELAMQQARDLARDEHLRSGQPTCVEIRDAGSVSNLGRFSRETQPTAPRYGDERACESRFLRWQW